MKQHLDQQEAIASQPNDISFNTFLPKALLLQLLEAGGGIRTYFGEKNDTRQFITIAAKDFHRFRGSKFYIVLQGEEVFRTSRKSLATRFKGSDIDFTNSNAEQLNTSVSIFNPTPRESGQMEIPDELAYSSPSAWFEKADILGLLNVEGCIGLRIFPGTAENIRSVDSQAKARRMNGEDVPEDELYSFADYPSLIMIGVDENGNDLETNNIESAAKPYVLSRMPCPPECGSGATTAFRPPSRPSS